MTEVRLFCLMEPTWSHNIEIGKKWKSLFFLRRVLAYRKREFSLPVWSETVGIMAWDEPFKSLTKNFTLNQKWNYARVSNPQYISPTFFHSFFPLVRKKFFFSRNGLTRPRSPTRGFWSTGSEMFPFQTAQNAAKTQRYLILFFWFLPHHDPSSK